MTNRNPPIALYDPRDFDRISGPDNGGPDYRSEPAIVPDHGAKVRLKRPSQDAYERDSVNLYRPDAPSSQSAREAMHEAESEQAWDRQRSKQRKIADLLSKIAREHAPRLSWRQDREISATIEREVLPDARFIAKSLPTNAQANVLVRFTQILWDEIIEARRVRQK